MGIRTHSVHVAGPLVAPASSRVAVNCLLPMRSVCKKTWFLGHFVRHRCRTRPPKDEYRGEGRRGRGGAVGWAELASPTSLAAGSPAEGRGGGRGEKGEGKERGEGRGENRRVGRACESHQLGSREPRRKGEGRRGRGEDRRGAERAQAWQQGAQWKGQGRRERGEGRREGRSGRGERGRGIRIPWVETTRLPAMGRYATDTLPLSSFSAI